MGNKERYINERSEELSIQMDTTVNGIRYGMYEILNLNIHLEFGKWLLEKKGSNLSMSSVEPDLHISCLFDYWIEEVYKFPETDVQGVKAQKNKEINELLGRIS